MPYYRVSGEIPRKRHIRFHRPEGGLYAEELMGEEGFSSDSALLYHSHPPTAIVKSEAFADVAAEARLTANHPLLPRHYRTQDLVGSGDLVLGRIPLLGNDDVRISFVSADVASGLYRNSTGDEAVYVHTGSLRFESVYGAIDAVPGDYVVIPRGTIHRWLPAGASEQDPAAYPATALVIEARGHIRTPSRYLSQTGQFLEHAPYCERDLRGPGSPVLAEGEDVPVIVRNRGGLTSLTYAYHPLDVVGWDGCLYPYAFNIADFEPIVKRTHAPPPVHQTFDGPNFVICSFCPRPLDFDPQAVPIPYNHHNVDSDRDGGHDRHIPPAAAVGPGRRRRGSRVPLELGQGRPWVNAVPARPEGPPEPPARGCQSAPERCSTRQTTSPWRPSILTAGRR